MHPDEGERLTIGAQQIIIKVDPQRAGIPVALATESLPPHAETFSLRLTAQDKIILAHKGQGRLLLDGRAVTLVPGIVVVIARQTWHSLHNTGTGVLTVAWVVSPGGIEGFYRELSRSSHPTELSQWQAVGQRYGIEVQPLSGVARPSEPRRRRRPSRRSRGSAEPARPPGASIAAPGTPVSEAPALAVAVTTPATPSPVTPPAGVPPSTSSPHRRRRRRGGRGRGRRAAQQPPSSAPAGKPGGAPRASPGHRADAPKGGDIPSPQRSSGPVWRGRAPRGKPERRHRGRHHGRVKEVYIDGRWVRVSGEGPVIALGGDQVATGSS